MGRNLKKICRSAGDLQIHRSAVLGEGNPLRLAVATGTSVTGEAPPHLPGAAAGGETLGAGGGRLEGDRGEHRSRVVDSVIIPWRGAVPPSGLSDGR